MSRIYWDSCIVIYRIQAVAPWSARIAERFETYLETAALHVTHLTQLECRVFPIRNGDMDLLSRYERFFARPEVRVMGLTQHVFDLATELRARQGLSTPDALHLAAAIAADCQEFWTNDRRLERAAAGRIAVVSVDDSP